MPVPEVAESFTGSVNCLTLGATKMRREGSICPAEPPIMLTCCAS